MPPPRKQPWVNWVLPLPLSHTLMLYIRFCLDPALGLLLPSALI